MKVELTNGQIKLINNMINTELHEINKTVYDGKELRDLKQALNLGDVSVSFVCGWCGNELCDSEKFNNTCFKCGKSPYSKQTAR